jgi:hypothetical protein
MMTTILLIVWMHFVADFLFQTDQMAINKSKSNKWLTIHIVCYIAIFFVFGWKYAIVNAIGHWITDWCSSRLTSYLWKKEQRHWFFVVIGLDQAIHLTTLILTIPLIA